MITFGSEWNTITIRKYKRLSDGVFVEAIKLSRPQYQFSTLDSMVERLNGFWNCWWVCHWDRRKFTLSCPKNFLTCYTLNGKSKDYLVKEPHTPNEFIIHDFKYTIVTPHRFEMTHVLVEED